MNPAVLKRQYQSLQRELASGQIDAAAFTAALDRLGFYDSQGRYWQIGAQSGAWYFYDPQSANWIQADPSVAGPKRGGLSARSILITNLVAALLLVWLVWPVEGAPALYQLGDSPLPTPTLATLLDTTGASSNGTISGTLTDLSSGRPGAGIEVVVGEAVARTDENGNFALSGLEAGTYVVSPRLEDQGTPAQGPLFVNLDGQSQAIVNLAYYSQAQPLPTDTPQAVLNTVPTPLPTPLPAATPPALPNAGGPGIPQHQPLVFMGLGLVLMALGSILLKTPW
ncbi:MAG: carboxypeptidase regulatory-like domain-containing protein [Anaerolineales bacterium]|nr:carboxypeptidase regulatory-like domain-containing protein [Anaerolineales bacterium]